MRIAPPSSHNSTTRSYAGAPSAPGVHDTLRHNLGLTTPLSTKPTDAASQIQSTHPLETRLAKWRETQDTLKMEGLRRQFGIAEPVRRGMELKIARDAGRDVEIGWEDVFIGKELREIPDFHTEMETRLQINW